VDPVRNKVTEAKVKEVLEIMGRGHRRGNSMGDALRTYKDANWDMQSEQIRLARS